MARTEIWYRCPVCKVVYDNQRDANICKNKHPIIEEKWAVGKGGKAVRIYDHRPPHSMHGVIGALREADLSDFIEEREQQLKEMEL